MGSTNVRARTIRLALASLALALGCGSSGGASTTGFVGSWTYQSGSIVAMCSGGLSVPDFPLTGYTVTLTEVDPTHLKLVINETDLTCNTNFTVSGSVASVEPNQTCNATFDNMSAPVELSTWTLTLTGGMLEQSMMGTASVSIISCNLSSSGTLTKPAADGATSG